LRRTSSKRRGRKPLRMPCGVTGIRGGKKASRHTRGKKILLGRCLPGGRAPEGLIPGGESGYVEVMLEIVGEGITIRSGGRPKMCPRMRLWTKGKRQTAKTYNEKESLSRVLGS